MVRFASLALLGALLAAPATAAPNVFWTFGFHFPAPGREPGGFGQAEPSDRLIQLAAADRRPIAPPVLASATPRVAAPDRLAALDLSPAWSRLLR